MILLFYSLLELIFTDFWGAAHITSHGGYKYYVSFVREEGNIVNFQTFKTMVELQLNSKVKNIQSDWDGEFRPFMQRLAHHGIVHRLICPHKNHQNGVIERKHRHIVELGLTLLHHPSLPLGFWDYAFVTVVYLPR